MLPEDAALYVCDCGSAFTASVTTSVIGPNEIHLYKNAATRTKIVGMPRAAKPSKRSSDLWMKSAFDMNFQQKTGAITVAAPERAAVYAALTFVRMPPRPSSPLLVPAIASRRLSDRSASLTSCASGLLRGSESNRPS